MSNVQRPYSVGCGVVAESTTKRAPFGLSTLDFRLWTLNFGDSFRFPNYWPASLPLLYSRLISPDHSLSKVIPMTIAHRASRTLVCLLLLFAFILSTLAQQPAQQPSQDDDVLRINTELVQTSVIVLDKQGKFVDGLKPEQFQVRVDGKPVTPTFLEQVIAGTTAEDKLLSRRGATNQQPGSEPTYRGRTMIFFIDDMHLSPQSVEQTRKAFLDFVENQMGPDDQVAVASPSGQIGFLQRFTDLKAVLRAAIARVTHRPYSIRDTENVALTEYTALKIDQGDRDALSYFTEELLKQTNYKTPGGPLGPTTPSPYGGKSVAQPPAGGMTRDMAERNVRERANVLLKQSAAITVNTLSTLEGLIRASSGLPGRKLFFFISDGFYLNDRNTAFNNRLKQITDAATRSGAVIYSLDARGLIGMTDASSNRADPTGRLAHANVGELSASQDALTALAADTGGKAFLNSGDLSGALKNAVKETSNYYILAWKPEAEEQKGGKFKQIEVSVVGRPDLSVRMPRGFFSTPPKSTAKPEAETKTTAATAKTDPKADEIRNALLATGPKHGLPTELAVSFVDVPTTGLVLTTATQVSTDALDYGTDGKQPAAVDVAGVVFNDLGKQVGGFKNRLNVAPSQSSLANPGVIYSHKLPLKPGLYQIRVAAQDAKSGRVGSAAQWIEIPDLTSKKLTLSSLLIGGQFIGSGQKQTSGEGSEEPMQFSVNRRFAKGAHMNFLTFIYNAARGQNNSPDLNAQIQIFRNGQTIVSSPIQKVVTDANTDLARIVYGADIALKTLPAGRYFLKVTVTDRVAQTSSTQQVAFQIE
jgi:VWFA-related protein